MTNEPIHGDALKAALEAQQPTREVSPTGEPIIPAKYVPYIAFAAAALVVVRDSLELPGIWPKLLGTLSSLLMLALGITPGWRRGAKVLALLFAMGLATEASASELTLFGSETKAIRAVIDEEVGVGGAPWMKYLEFGTALGVELRAGKATPAVLAVGGIGLADVAGVQLSLVAGGGAVLGAEEVGFPFLLGASAGWKRGPLKVALFAAGAYHAPPQSGWSLVTGLSFSG